MNKQDIQLLYKYNHWANTRILNAASNLTPEQFLAPASFPHQELRGTLTHVLFAEWLWRSRLQVNCRHITSSLRFSNLRFAPRALAGGGKSDELFYSVGLTDEN